jgi:hypothetical protein
MTGGFTSEYGNRLAAARPQHAFGRRSRRARRREFPRRHRRESRSQCRLPAGIAAWVIASLWMVLLPGASSIPRNRRSFTTSARDRESPAQFDGHAGNQEKLLLMGGSAFDQTHTGTAQIFYHQRWHGFWTGSALRYGSATLIEHGARRPQHFTCDLASGIDLWNAAPAGVGI